MESTRSLPAPLPQALPLFDSCQPGKDQHHQSPTKHPTVRLEYRATEHPIPMMRDSPSPARQWAVSVGLDPGQIPEIEPPLTPPTDGSSLDRTINERR